MGFFEALIISIGLFFGLAVLGGEIRRGLVEAAKVNKGEDDSATSVSD